MQVFSITDIGKKRELNEDYIYVSCDPVGVLPNLFIVADGMGGHNAGDYASEHTVKKIVETIQKSEHTDAVKAVKEAIETANAYIYECAKNNESLSGMGTTVVVATISGEDMLVANVGDSRLYVSQDELKQITKDHSLVEEMITLGGIDREAARNHPDKNIITRAIGVKESVLIDMFEVKVSEKDTILLCTDGLTNMLRDETIHSIIRENDNLENAAKKLVQEANACGGRDNIAVVLVGLLGGNQ